MLDGGERSEHDQLEDEVGEGAKNDKVVEAGLDLAHLGGPPVGHPVDEPEEISDECDGHQQHQLQLVVLHRQTDQKTVSQTWSLS